MKTLGLIGGTSWHSTIDYYRIINRIVSQRLGGLNSAKLLLYSVNLEELIKFPNVGDWNGAAAYLGDIAVKLEEAGAEYLVLCANTMHIVADKIQASISIPIIHIADATAKALTEKNLSKVGLLGTKFTMESDFLKNKLSESGIEVIVPDEKDRIWIQETIERELGRGILLPETKSQYIRVIDTLINAGAKGVILGCTEIPMLIKPEDVPVPSFDTTEIHARIAAEYALS